ncbi:hypothetical protein ACFO4E_19410 [Nocardiopsis mangrovi]|uniref:Uncharacterized protein n=1 Tax=Nocardiopsis mangrovi TaxID=1179818 RepID=A0ABV9E0V9_9ACTN
MLAQILPLAGVVIGALASYLATAMAERARFRRSMAIRWDERRMDVYVEYTSHVKKMLKLGEKILRDPADPAGRQADLEALEEERSARFEALALLADPATTDAAHTVNRQVARLLRATREPDRTEPPAAGGPSLGDDVVAALNTFHAAARRGLGVSSGSPL